VSFKSLVQWAILKSQKQQQPSKSPEYGFMDSSFDGSASLSSLKMALSLALRPISACSVVGRTDIV
jgi:hypothetical protein